VARTAEGRARTRAAARAGLPIAAAMVLASLAAAAPLEGREVVLHRGFGGEATRTGPATELLVLFPVLGWMLLGMMFVAAQDLGPRRDGCPPPSARAMGWMTGGVVGVFAAMHALVLAEALGWVESLSAGVVGVMGLGALAVGLVLLLPSTAKGARVTMINLRLPSSESGQARVSRVAGLIPLLTGLLTVISALWAEPWVATSILLAGLLAWVPAVSVVASRERRADAQH
jgi:hypothetical protein